MSRQKILIVEDEIVLRDPSQKQPIRIPVDDIDAKRQGASLMPTGLTENLANKQEFLDLALFLSRLGRPGEYMTTTQPVIRRWQVLKNESPSQLLELTSVPERANWVVAYAKVLGELPAEEFVGTRSAFVRGAINVLQPGSATLRLNSTKGLRVWLDDNELQDPSAELELTRGRRVLTFLIDHAARGNEGLRVELLDAPDGKARYQVEGGE